MATVSFTGVKSCTASGDAIDVVFTTRYSGDLSVTMTRACLGELVAALSRDAGAAAAAAQASSPPPEGKPESPRESITKAPGSTSAQSGAPAPVAAPMAPAATTPDGNIAVRVPKRWSVAAETNLHNVVLLFFDPQTPKQSSFALSPKAAAQMANGLIEKAKVVASSRAARKEEAKPSIDDP